jgi:hypothetical protein
MTPAAVALLVALVGAPACGGGGGSSSGSGGSPNPVAASFTPDQATPGPDTAAMGQGAKSNDVVTVNVTLTGVNGAFATAFEVTYDDFHTQFLGWSKGNAFEQGGDTPNYTVDGTSNPGRIVIGIARTSGTTTNITGTSTMLSLQFRVKQAGVYPLAVQNAAVYGGQSPNPQPIPGITWFAGSVTGV